jgi:hypothetical protein
VRGVILVLAAIMLALLIAAVNAQERERGTTIIPDKVHDVGNQPFEIESIPAGRRAATVTLDRTNLTNPRSVVTVTIGSCSAKTKGGVLRNPDGTIKTASTLRCSIPASARELSGSLDVRGAAARTRAEVTLR